MFENEIKVPSLLLKKWLDQTISQLLHNEDIDTRTANIATKADLETLGDLLQCFVSNAHSLKHLENAGKKVDAGMDALLRQGCLEFGLTMSAMARILNRYENTNSSGKPPKIGKLHADRQIWLSQSIDELLQDERIDTRTYNIAKKEGIATLEELIGTYLKHGNSLRHLENAGKRVDGLINELLLEGIRHQGIVQASFKDGKYEDKMPDLGEDGHGSFPFSTGQLSIQGIEAVNKVWMACGESSVRLIEILVDKERWSAFIPYPADVMKLEVYWPSIAFELAINTGRLDEQKLLILSLVKEHFSQASISAVHLLMSREFCSFDLLLLLNENRSGKGSRNDEIAILYLSAHHETNQETLESIADRYDLTRERVRQIVGTFLERFEATLHRFTLIFSSFCYALIPTELLDNDRFVVTKSSISEIILSEKVSLHYELKLRFLAAILHERFLWVNADSRNLASAIFVRKRLWDLINIEGLKVLVDDSKLSPSAKTFSIDLETVIENYVDSRCSPQFRTRIAIIIPELLTEMVGLHVGLDGKFHLYRHTESKLIKSLMEQHLLEYETPMQLSSLFEAIGGSKRFPNVEGSAVNALIKEIQNVIAIRLSGYYYHVANDSKIPAIGPWSTFEELVIEFLKTATYPQHISLVEKFVFTFRPSDRESLENTLRSAHSSRLVEHGGGFWGLKGKQYSHFTFPNVPPFTFKLVNVMLREKGKFGIGIRELSNKLKASHGLKRVQVEDWVNYRAAAGKLIRKGDRIYGCDDQEN